MMSRDNPPRAYDRGVLPTCRRSGEDNYLLTLSLFQIAVSRSNAKIPDDERATRLELK